MNPAALLSDGDPFPGCIDPTQVDVSPTPDDRHQTIGKSIFLSGRPIGDCMSMERRRAKALPYILALVRE